MLLLLMLVLLLKDSHLLKLRLSRCRLSLGHLPWSSWLLSRGAHLLLLQSVEHRLSLDSGHYLRSSLLLVKHGFHTLERDACCHRLHDLRYYLLRA